MVRSGGGSLSGMDWIIWALLILLVAGGIIYGAVYSAVLAALRQHQRTSATLDAGEEQRP